MDHNPIFWLIKNKQSTYYEKIRLGSDFYIIVEIKKWLNINSKPDNKCLIGDDII